MFLIAQSTRVGLVDALWVDALWFKGDFPFVGN
jgi:hypothetical protein